MYSLGRDFEFAPKQGQDDLVLLSSNQKTVSTYILQIFNISCKNAYFFHQVLSCRKMNLNKQLAIGFLLLVVVLLNKPFLAEAGPLTTTACVSLCLAGPCAAATALCKFLTLFSKIIMLMNSNSVQGSI